MADQGPLQGVRVIEFAGLGAAPFAAMLLADLGADVVRIDRIGRLAAPFPEPEKDVLGRNRRSIGLDLKTEGAAEVMLRLLEATDALIEGFRPGVMERLGLGPQEVMARNPAIIYARMTGWGQQGPLAASPGHDINYIALSGLLGSIGEAGRSPLPPLNLAGDFGGGGMLVALGIVSALLAARQSGEGRVIDAAMVDGSALLMALMHGMKAMGLWQAGRGVNLFDGGAPFYRTYQTLDRKYVAVGALEPQFYRALLSGLGLAGEIEAGEQMNRALWPATGERFADVFRQATRKQWVERLGGGDACLSPVLDLDEAPADPHLKARNTFVEAFGVLQPAPAPRFGGRAPVKPSKPPLAGEQTDEILKEAGYPAADIRKLREQKVIG